MVGIRMDKPWLDLSKEAIDALPGQLGVYQIADSADDVVKIGYAGGLEQFGIRTALHRELDAGATRFRIELTHGYLTRWEELLMVHLHDHGELPPGNSNHDQKLGRLRIDGAGPEQKNEASVKGTN